MFHTGDEFLREIERQPAERTLRLVYADWLDEHDDVRGELIRVEEEMRQAPVYSDRFWELKPRRNELRTKVGAEWCGRMRYGTECEPVFRHGIPDGWRERWRLIREFTERWHRVPLGDIGGRQQEIAEVEARLGRKLSPSVREWIAFAQDVRTLTDYHDVFGDVFRLGDVPSQPAVSLLVSGDDGYHMGIPHADFEQPDPPVHRYLCNWEEVPRSIYVPDGGSPRHSSVTEFALAFVVLSINLGDGVRTTLRTDPFVGKVQANLTVRVRIGNLDIHQSDNLTIALDGSHTSQRITVWIRIGGPNPREEIPAFIWEFINRDHRPRPELGDLIPF